MQDHRLSQPPWRKISLRPLLHRSSRYLVLGAGPLSPYFKKPACSPALLEKPIEFFLPFNQMLISVNEIAMERIMKLRTGSAYKTECGRRAIVTEIYRAADISGNLTKLARVSIDGIKSPVSGGVFVYQMDGTFNGDHAVYPGMNIVSEWIGDPTEAVPMIEARPIGPVQSVKKLVSGTYGKIVVHDNAVTFDGIFISRPEPSRHLREAAATMIEIADFLDEQNDL